MAANIGGSQTSEFGLGHTPLTNSGRGNDYTMSPAGISDQGLQDTSARFNSLVPHAVVQAATTGGEDQGYQAIEREQGGYAAGSMPMFEDELSDGSDNFS